ncbi:MAG TPA: hypothetical protein VJS90_06270 [Pseudomonas sp.]|uniref:hypothetical protein n=1 Tax=Pseudomonas sp. TaxID=306 RepID=UPI002B480331|nr:hypothetical protein [Pseudomonas sp.]HKS12629.1 hypothetical protein [Pseudomonas sp.]
MTTPYTPGSPDTHPVDPDPGNPPREEPVEESMPRGLPDKPEQYPDDEDMPLPND